MTKISEKERIMKLASEHGLTLDVHSIEFDESGADFQVAFGNDLKGGPWVLRIPRRENVVEVALYEKKIVNFLNQKVRFQVPCWEICTPTLIAYPMLEGKPAATIDPNEKAYVWYIDENDPPSCFFDSLAEVMVELHGIDHQQAHEEGIKVSAPREIRESLAKQMNEVKKDFAINEKLWERWQNWLSDDSFWPQHSAFVHGDLHPGHILVNEDHVVTGLLDWTEAKVSDPATDFVLFCAVFGKERLESFVKKYEAAGGKTWPRMVEHIEERHAAYPLLIAQFALITGEKEYIEMAKQALA
ncbi:macrolide phosphotransferase [Bacillus pakistanensis]|uniref:Macrolide phosphotransferase n=1 Tax=Rossellomorea pakistanensis TaxID=992288 RepID=A0ABS2NII2_9BACI|nr:macrolide 2'-phosphotransferase [Bacillus pakistanensis]MBM7587662.1 macrolide phosphotransferase [Bacillus pakistanensis]